MKHTAHRLLDWTARLLAFAYIGFLLLFTLPVFDHEYTAGQTIIALLIQLIPNAIVLAALLLAWRWRVFGGSAFLALGAGYIVWAWGAFPLSVYAVIAGPLALIGVLFILSGAFGSPRNAHGLHLGKRGDREGTLVAD